jgi:NTE family protein
MGPVTRIGLVLGAGGVAGGAWHAGALAALAEVTGWDPRGAAVVVGTSAGSISGTALRAGLDADDQWRLAVGEALSPAGARVHGRITTDEAAVGRLRAPRGLPANPALVLAMASRTPRPGVALAGLLPEGAVSTTGIRGRIDELTGGDWPSGALAVVAVDLASGSRAVFRGDGQPVDASPGEAVAASCAVPAFFAPVAIGDRRYVDGGVHSPTNADLLAGEGLDAVVVSAPMAGRWRSLRPHPQSISRTAARVALDREVGAVRRAGTPVLVLQPGPDDTPLMDGRSMDPGSRQPVARRARRSVTAHLAALVERADDPVLAALRR